LTTLRERRRKFQGVTVAAAALAVAAIYLIFRSAYYFPDGMRWELAIAEFGAPAIWHPHHLLYNPLALAFREGLILFGYGGRLLGAMRILDALVGGAGFIVFYFIVRKADAPRPLALAGSFALAFSFGYWAYACNAESVIVSTVAAMAAFLAAQWASEGRGFRRWAACAVVTGAAVLTHVTNALLFPFLVAAYLISRPRYRFRRLPALVLAYLAPAVAVYLAVGVGILGLDGASEFARWLFGTPGRTHYYMSYRLVNVALDFYALGRNVFGLRWFKDVWAGGWTWQAAGLAALTAVGAAAFAFAFVAAVRRFARRGAPRRQAWLALAFFLPYAVFFTFRDAGGTDRWTPQLFALIFFLYAGAGAASLRRLGKGVLYALPVLLFTANFWGSIYPESKPEYNEHLAFARFVDRITNPGDVVIFSGLEGLGPGVYADYFAGVESTGVYFGARDPETFRRRIRAALAAGHAVYVSDARAEVTTIDLTAPGAREKYAVNGEAARKLLAGYDREFVGTYEGLRYEPSNFWRLIPKNKSR
jgi:hypothetical protein